jgi:hypothetical protein
MNELNASITGWNVDIFKRRRAISEVCKSIEALKSLCDDDYPLSWIYASQFFFPIAEGCRESEKKMNSAQPMDTQDTIIVLSARIILGHFHQIVDWVQMLLDGLQRAVDKSQRENHAPHRIDLTQRAQHDYVQSIEPFLCFIARLFLPLDMSAKTSGALSGQSQDHLQWKFCAELMQKIHNLSPFKALYTSVFLWLTDHERWDGVPDYTSHTQMIYSLIIHSMTWRTRKVLYSPTTTSVVRETDLSKGLIIFRDPAQAARTVNSLFYQAKKHLPLSFWISSLVDLLFSLDFTAPELYYLLSEGDTLVSLVSITHTHLAAFRDFGDHESHLLLQHWGALQFLLQIHHSLLTVDQLVFPTRANNNGDLARLLARLLKLSSYCESSAPSRQMPDLTRSALVDLIQSLIPTMIHYQTIRSFAPDIHKFSTRHPEWRNGDDDLSRAWKDLDNAVKVGVVKRKDFLKRKHELCGNPKASHLPHLPSFSLSYKPNSSARIPPYILKTRRNVRVVVG